MKAYDVANPKPSGIDGVFHGFKRMTHSISVGWEALQFSLHTWIYGKSPMIAGWIF